MRKERTKKNDKYILQRESKRDCTEGPDWWMVLRVAEEDGGNKLLWEVWDACGWKWMDEEVVG